jgi:hypothetical protein
MSDSDMTRADAALERTRLIGPDLDDAGRAAFRAGYFEGSRDTARELFDDSIARVRGVEQRANELGGHVERLEQSLTQLRERILEGDTERWAFKAGYVAGATEAARASDPGDAELARVAARDRLVAAARCWLESWEASNVKPDPGDLPFEAALYRAAVDLRALEQGATGSAPGGATGAPPPPPEVPTFPDTRPKDITGEPVGDGAPRSLDSWLDGRDFYELMQGYRMASFASQSHVVEAFERVKRAIRNGSGEGRRRAARAARVGAELCPSHAFARRAARARAPGSVVSVRHGARRARRAPGRRRRRRAAPPAGAGRVPAHGAAPRPREAPAVNLPDCICARLGPVDDGRRCAACPLRATMPSIPAPPLAPPGAPPPGAAAREGACPYGSGEHRKRGDILASRSWQLPAPALHLPWPVRALLIAGAIGDYAAYMGIGDRAWVAEHGVKLAFGDAVLLFPAIDPRRYRP